MKSLKKHIYLFFLVVIMGCSGPNIIPRGELSEIYAEMLMLDQWINSNLHVKTAADTSFVYGEILESRGYTREDYIATVTRYMKDPNKFAKVFNKAQDIIQKEIDIADYQLKMEKYKVLKDFPELKYLYFYINQEPYMHCYDSLGCDTIQPFYLKPTYTLSDTVWDGITFTLRDSLEVEDSLELKGKKELTEKTQDKNLPDLTRTRPQLPENFKSKTIKGEKRKVEEAPLKLKELPVSIDTVETLIKGVKR